MTEVEKGKCMYQTKYRDDGTRGEELHLALQRSVVFISCRMLVKVHCTAPAIR
jgi:hypothetical protein